MLVDEKTKEKLTRWENNVLEQYKNFNYTYDKINPLGWYDKAKHLLASVLINTTLGKSNLPFSLQIENDRNDKLRYKLIHFFSDMNTLKTMVPAEYKLDHLFVVYESPVTAVSEQILLGIELALFTSVNCNDSTRIVISTEDGEKYNLKGYFNGYYVTIDLYKEDLHSYTGV